MLCTTYLIIDRYVPSNITMILFFLGAFSGGPSEFCYMYHIYCLPPFPSSLSLLLLLLYLPVPPCLPASLPPCLPLSDTRSNTGILERFSEFGIGCVWCIDWDCHFKLTTLEVFTDQSMDFSAPFPLQTWIPGALPPKPDRRCPCTPPEA